MANNAAQQQLVAIDKTLDTMAPQFESMLPEHVTVDRFKRMSLNAITQNPGLLECDRKSLFIAIREAAAAGLELGGFQGEGYLTPFKKRVVFVPGYRGLLKLVRQSGLVTSIECEVFRRTDKVTYTGGDDGKFSVEFNWEDDTGDIIGAYAVARFHDGSFQRVVMSKKKIDTIKNASPSGQSRSSPWNNHYEEMAKKTVIRRLCKLLPMSREMSVAVARDEGVNETGKVSAKDLGAFVIDGSGQSMDHGVGEAAEDVEQKKQTARGKKENTEPSDDVTDVDAETGEVIEPEKKSRAETLQDSVKDKGNPALDDDDPDDAGDLLGEDDGDDDGNDAPV